MRILFVILQIALVIIDIGLFLYIYKLFKKYAHGDELIVPTKKVLPYIVMMAIISILIPAIGLWMHLI